MYERKCTHSILNNTNIKYGVKSHCADGSITYYFSCTYKITLFYLMKTVAFYFLSLYTPLYFCSSLSYFIHIFICTFSHLFPISFLSSTHCISQYWQFAVHSYVWNMIKHFIFTFRKIMLQKINKISKLAFHWTVCRKISKYYKFIQSFRIS